jgi:hypothetical protein
MNLVKRFIRLTISGCYEEMAEFLEKSQANPLSIAMTEPRDGDCSIILVYAAKESNGYITGAPAHGN